VKIARELSIFQLIYLSHCKRIVLSTKILILIFVTMLAGSLSNKTEQEQDDTQQNISYMETLKAAGFFFLTTRRI